MFSAKIRSKINSANKFYYALLNIFGFAYCGENFMLALETHAFIYEYKYKIKQ